jgi:hypothetical protein
MSKSLIRKNQLDPDISDLVGQYGSGYFYSKTLFVLVNESENFTISDEYNNKIILANSSSLINGQITISNSVGFNTSIVQIGSAQVQITGDVSVIINSYNNQYRTAGQFATISLLHTGNNGYLMYGNSST